MPDRTTRSGFLLAALLLAGATAGTAATAAPATATEPQHPPIDLSGLPPTGAWVIALPMKIAGGSGGPVRIVALVPAEARP